MRFNVIQTTTRTISRLPCLSFARTTSPVRSRRCWKGRRAFQARERFSGVWALLPLSKETPQKPASSSNAPWICCPEWPGSYSTLGVFYFQTGQIDKAKEVLNRFKNSNASGALDVNRIEQVLAQAPAAIRGGNEPMTMANRAQLLQMALSLADRTL